jgi:20S proteasome alpha/beta subunit
MFELLYHYLQEDNFGIGSKQNYKPDFRDKIFGDIKHYLIGYTGDVNLFDIFRRYTVGDIMIERDTDKRYQVDNLLMKVSETIKRFSALRCTPFKVLIAAHRGNASVLYHIDTDGRSNEIIEYKSIGSGSIIADKFCSSPERDRITMRDFAKYAGDPLYGSILSGPWCGC